MTRTGRSSIPFHRRLGVRIGLLLFLGILIVDVFTLPLWNWLYYELTPEWSDPDRIRQFADELEAMTPAEVAAYQWHGSDLTASGWLIVIAVNLAYAGFFALLIGCALSYLTTRRISRLTGQAARPGQDGLAVPGPFDVRGKDEVAVLASTMNQMRAEIEALLVQIEEKDRTRRQWVAEVSHDLRTPLTALSVALEQSRARAEAVTDEESRRGLQDLLSSAVFDVQRVSSLAEDLLEIARLEAGDELTREPVPVGELLRDLARELSPVAEQKGVHLEVDIPGGLPELVGDGRRLMRCLENLILNSIQHARGRVWVRADVRDDQVAVDVRDDGPGLPESGGKVVLEELREHLGRRDSAGIGLEVAEKVVVAHGGQLTARNHDDGGALLQILLPRDSDPSGADAA